jgi:hypothetical protein
MEKVEIGLKRCNDKIKVNKRTRSRTPTTATLFLNNRKYVNGKVNRENLPGAESQPADPSARVVIQQIALNALPSINELSYPRKSVVL